VTGTIIRLVPNKGYCFIRGDDGISRFGHARAFSDPLAFDLAREGQAVTYTPVIDARGRAGGARAMNITLLPAGYAVEKL
jgi:cold shock CspA family protein